MILIYLALNDREYQEKLAEGLAWRGSGWEVHSFWDDEKLPVKPAEKAIWLLPAEPDGQRGVAESLHQQKNTLKMSQTPTQEEGECFCYQPLSEICKCLTERLYQLGLVEAPVSGTDEPERSYLYSPFGGIGVSDLAYRLAKELSRRWKTLLISFDAYQNFSREFIPFRLSDFLFYWKTLGQVNVCDFCLHEGGLDILHGPVEPEDLAVLRTGEKKDFMRILKQGGYQQIVFDLSSSGLLNWCLPLEEKERLFVVKRLAEKWKQFAAAVRFDYVAVSEEGALAEMLNMIRQGTAPGASLPEDKR